MSHRLTCLVDNTVHRRSALWGEHGLSFLIETGPARVLFDTGRSGRVLLHNARELDVDLGSITALALSHAHRDHTGGLKAVLKRVGQVPLFAHPDLFRERFSRRARKTRAIGLSVSQKKLARRVELRLSAEPQEVAPGVWTTGEVAPHPEPEGRSASHLIRDGGCLLPDPYWDDMSLVLDTVAGLVVVCGCCHAGLLNTLAHVRRTFGVDITAVAGGGHLLQADEAHLRRVIEVLRELCMSRLYLNHCAGQQAYVTLAQAFGEMVAPCPVGTSLEF